MRKEETLKPQTPSQTIGPYFAYGLTPEQYNFDFKSAVSNDMTYEGEGDEAIEIVGKVYDGEGNAISDAMIELWQNDGVHNRFGRYGTGTERGNGFIFKTVKPKPVAGQAPFINVILFMRGQLLHSYTRIYFSDEEALNARDEVLNSLSEERRELLIAQKTKTNYMFDIHMQGSKESVFFKV